MWFKKRREKRQIIDFCYFFFDKMLVKNDCRVYTKYQNMSLYVKISQDSNSENQIAIYSAILE